MARRGTVKLDDFRILFRSAPFPPRIRLRARPALEPKLRDKLVGCFMNYKYTRKWSKPLTVTTTSRQPII